LVKAHGNRHFLSFVEKLKNHRKDFIAAVWHLSQHRSCHIAIRTVMHTFPAVQSDRLGWNFQVIRQWAKYDSLHNFAQTNGFWDG
jgi:hypothetical protein